jgi:hypothetical protein
MNEQKNQFIIFGLQSVLNHPADEQYFPIERIIGSRERERQREKETARQKEIERQRVPLK